MPLLNSFYAWLLALAAYGTIDFNDYTLLETNDKGFSFYLDESDTYIIQATIDNHLVAYTQTRLGESIEDLSLFFIGIQLADDTMIAGLNGFILQGMSGEIKSEKICFVEAVWVDEAYRHQGLGTLLMQQAEDYARKQDCLIIKTQAYQIDHANEFFEKIGFNYTVITPSPEHLKGHAVYEIMTKKLDRNNDQQGSFIDLSAKGYKMYQGYPLVQGNLGTLPEVKTFVATRLSNLFKTDQAKQYADAINEKLTDYRKSQGASRPQNKFTIFIVSPDKQIIGGAIGEVEDIPGFGNWLNIHDVAINADYRKHQLGRELFKQIDVYAKSKNCKYEQLWTGEWQARGFYEKVGFTVVTTFPRSEHTWNQEGYRLRKQLE